MNNINKNNFNTQAYIIKLNEITKNNLTRDPNNSNQYQNSDVKYNNSLNPYNIYKTIGNKMEILIDQIKNVFEKNILEPIYEVQIKEYINEIGKSITDRAAKEQQNTLNNMNFNEIQKDFKDLKKIFNDISNNQDKLTSLDAKVEIKIKNFNIEQRKHFITIKDNVNAFIKRGEEKLNTYKENANNKKFFWVKNKKKEEEKATVEKNKLIDNLIKELNKIKMELRSNAEGISLRSDFNQDNKNTINSNIDSAITRLKKEQKTGITMKTISFIKAFLLLFTKFIKKSKTMSNIDNINNDYLLGIYIKDASEHLTKIEQISTEYKNNLHR